jgi:hypothetical protein
MAKSNRRFFGWCPAPEPNSFRSLRQYNRPLFALITMATLICSVAAASYIAFSSTAAVAAPLVSQPEIPTQTPAPENNTLETIADTPTSSSSSASSSSTSSVSTSSQPSNGSQTSAPPSSYSISGYVLNSNGNGVANANVTFSAQGTLTDNSGHYQINAAAGTYTITVTPPPGSNYLIYSQTGFVVNSTTIKNITLTTFYYVSGYVTDSTGAPIIRAEVSFGNTSFRNCTGFDGYYYMLVPAGTYTLTVTPKTGDNYAVYVENNFVVNVNTVKNITLASIP